MSINRVSNTVSRSLAIGALSLVAGSAMAQTASPTPPAQYPLIGIVRDFAPGTADFAPGVAANLGHSIGNVASSLNSNGLPVYQGGGRAVQTQAHDVEGRPISPAMVGVGPLTTFTITDSTITSTQGMAAKVTVIGAAISYGGDYDMAVTTRIMGGTQALTPFGSFDGAMTGNVNDGGNPRSFILPSIISPGTRLSVDGRSWSRKNASNPSPADSDWDDYMTVNSGSGGGNVRALRNGDSVPNVAGFLNQTSVSQMVSGYVDSVTKKVRLASNQVIYLFELGVTNSNSTAFDMQDLVVLVELATDPSYFITPGTVIPPCITINDAAAVMGAANSGGITSPGTFAQWFMDYSGVNASDRLTLMMTRDANGVYSYSTSDFHPIDGEIYGNQGDAHNRGFTFSFGGSATYTQCARQYFEYAGDGDAWLFVNGKLVLDMGGFHVNTRQVIDLDRLGLRDGENAHIQFFYAERATNLAAFSIKTNIVLRSDINSVNTPAVTGLHD